MFLVIHASSAPKLLLIPTRCLAVSPRLRLCKQIKRAFLADWDHNFNTRGLFLLYFHRCKVSLLVIRSFH